MRNVCEKVVFLVEMEIFSNFIEKIRKIPITFRLLLNKYHISSAFAKIQRIYSKLCPFVNKQTSTCRFME